MKKVNEARKKVTPDHPRVPAEVPRHHFWQIEIGISAKNALKITRAKDIINATF